MPSPQYYLFKPWMKLARWAQGIFPIQNDHSVVRFRITADILANIAIHPPRLVNVINGSIAGVAGDWFIPKDAPENPVILFFHGGGIVFGWNNSMRRELAYIARFAGLRAFGVDYRLAPDHRYPVAHDECHGVYRAIVQSGTQVVLIGESSGAVLALSTMLRARKAQFDQPLLCVLISPVVDFEFSNVNLQQFNDAFAHPKFVAGIHKHYMEENEIPQPELSPIHTDLTGIAPLFVLAGEKEILRGEVDRLSEATNKYNISMDTILFPKVWHSWHALVPQLPEAMHALETIGSAIRLRTENKPDIREKMKPHYP